METVIENIWFLNTSENYCLNLWKSFYFPLAYCCLVELFKSCLTLCDPHGLQHVILHDLIKQYDQSHVHWVSDAIQSSISSFIIPFSSCPQSFPASGSFPCVHGSSHQVQKYWSFSSNEYSGLISFRLTSLISLQSKGLSRVFSSTTIQKPSILWHSAFFMVWLLHLYMTNGKTIALTIWTSVGSDVSAFW